MGDKGKIYTNSNMSKKSTQGNQSLQIGILMSHKVIEKE